jgi:hypothetical protein
MYCPQHHCKCKNFRRKTQASAVQDIVEKDAGTLELAAGDFGPGITCRKYGYGTAIYVTGFLGGTAFSQKETGLAQVLASLTNYLGIRPEMIAGQPGLSMNKCPQN